MKKLALALSSKDRVDLTRQTLDTPRERIDCNIDLFWNDGSTTVEGQEYFEGTARRDGWTKTRVTGGPDRAIVFALSQMLADPSYTHVGLLENDVLLDHDWLEPTLALFDNPEGLPVGAVSARSYADRILIQRDGYAVMHNVGAGHVIFTREAASIILTNYRTGWWPENRSVFAQLSGLDIGKWGAFHHNDQMVTADWSWDTILAAHGLATVALTPSKATMIGQEIPLEQQGLQLVHSERGVFQRTDTAAFGRFCSTLEKVWWKNYALPPVDWQLRTAQSRMIFPHHISKLDGYYIGNWCTRWSQGFGPFTYVAAERCTLIVPVFGACAFHVSGGKVALHDQATGYHTEADLPPGFDSISITVPRNLQYGTIELTFSAGACFHGLETSRPQPWRPAPFDYNTLPPVEEKRDD